MHVAEEDLSMAGLLREQGPRCGASKTVGLARESSQGVGTTAKSGGVTWTRPVTRGYPIR